MNNLIKNSSIDKIAIIHANFLNIFKIKGPFDGRKEMDELKHELNFNPLLRRVYERQLSIMDEARSYDYTDFIMNYEIKKAIKSVDVDNENTLFQLVFAEKLFNNHNIIFLEDYDYLVEDFISFINPLVSNECLNKIIDILKDNFDLGQHYNEVNDDQKMLQYLLESIGENCDDELSKNIMESFQGKINKDKDINDLGMNY